MNLPEMLIDIHNEINDLRQLEHYLRTEEFKLYYEHLRDTTELEYLIKTRNLIAIKAIVIPHRPLLEKTIKELRRIAAGLQIKNYHLKSKDDLIRDIERCRIQETQLQQSKSYTNV